MKVPHPYGEKEARAFIESDKTNSLTLAVMCEEQLIGCVSLDDLDAADEVFVTGTSVELRPVVSLDRPGKHSTWPVGRITKALREAFRASTRAHA